MKMNRWFDWQSLDYEREMEFRFMSEHIVDTFGIVQEFADLHGDMSTPLYRAIMDVIASRQREEIVRCKDCRHYHASFNICDEFGDRWHGRYTTVDPDGFCFRGKRKGIEDES